MELLWTDGPQQLLCCTFASVGLLAGIAAFITPEGLHSESTDVSRLIQGDEYYAGGKAVRHFKLEGALAAKGSIAGWPTASWNGYPLVTGGSGDYTADGNYTERFQTFVSSSRACVVAVSFWQKESGYAWRAGKLAGVDLVTKRGYTWNTSSKRFNMKTVDPAIWTEVTNYAKLFVSGLKGGYTHSTFSTTLNLPKPDLTLVRTFASHAMNLATEFVPAPSHERLLYQEAVKGQKRFDGNLINFASKLSGIGTTARAALSLAADPTDPKAWASMWLAGRFSDRLMLRNAEQLSKAYLREINECLVLHEQVSRTSREYSQQSQLSFFGRIECDSHARLVCSNGSASDLMSAVKKLYEWDAWPTLENAWDLVPFSFVVDWFLSVGTILDNIDNMVYNQYLVVKLYERSDKIVFYFNPKQVASVFSDLFDVSGLYLSYYHRYSASPPPLGVLDGWDLSFPSPTNVGDAIALAVQVN